MLSKRVPVFLPLTAALLAAVAGAPRAGAAGFQLRDQSGSGQGNAYAGIAAGGSDISSMFFNPATMIRFSGNQLQFGLTGIFPKAQLDGVTATRTDGSAIGGASSIGNAASSTVIPTLYAMWSVDEDFKLGFSINVPFGLSTDYPADWAGRYQAVQSYLQTVDYAPSFAWRTSPEWTWGGAFVARRAKAHLSQAMDLGYTAQNQLIGLQDSLNAGGIPGTLDTGTLGPGSGDGLADVRGSGWAYGFRLGALFEPSPRLHIGLGYQSRIRETIKGSASFSVPASLSGQLSSIASNPSNQWANSPEPFLTSEIQSLQAQLTNTSASAVLHLPSTWALGVDYQVTDAVSVQVELDRTQWSSFHELRVHFGDPSVQPDQVTEEHWKDTTFFSVGTTWRRDAHWTYRAGLALDTTPVPDSSRDPRIPDSDRYWLSAGASYQFTKHFGVDAGYTHVFMKNASMNLQGGTDPTSNQFYQGNLSGTYKNSIDILSVQARYKF